jgi:hypothetical protein
MRSTASSSGCPEAKAPERLRQGGSELAAVPSTASARAAERRQRGGACAVSGGSPRRRLDSGGRDRRVHQCRLAVDFGFSFEAHPYLHGHLDGSLVCRIDQTDQAR